MDISSTAQLLTDLFGYARDLAVVGFIILCAWKGRGVYDQAMSFVYETRTFMTTMANHTDLLVSNHLKHLEESGSRIETTLNAQNILLTTIIGQGQKKGKR